MTQVDPEQHRQLALDILRELRRQGYETYWAGGCVRDLLLGCEPEDYDVATSARPEEVRRVFGRRRTLEVGASFGVVCVLGSAEAGQIEVAAFRSDVGYSDGRRPDEVIFSSPAEDAARRDFTINGMFFDPLTEEVIDFVGGREDLQRGVIRAIGEPSARLAEDKLRMLRGVRFVARLGFQLDGPTRQAIQAHADAITIVSAERIAQEMRKMLVLPTRRRAVELLAEVGLLAVLLPEIPQPVPGAAVSSAQSPAWLRTLRALELLERPVFEVALAALLHAGNVSSEAGDAGGKPAAGAVRRRGPLASGAVGLAQVVVERWRLSRRESQTLLALLRDVVGLHEAPRWPVSRLKRLLAQPHRDQLLALGRALAEAGDGDLRGVRHCEQFLADVSAEQLQPVPLISGHDLMALNVTPGPQYQRLLERIYDAQLDAVVKTAEEARALLAQWIEAENFGG